MIPTKKIALALLSVTALASSVPAFAGPDWTVIERARAQKQAQAKTQAQTPCALKNDQAASAPGADSKAN
ncbi:hypothetical protein P3W85_31215 [Cupriavidus basilensis]|uniref:Uncharacterized protein n=1 Tax=Cupriavidus basilensis TaxID=68895 RepID=A0ABT6AXN5_9BURK|nr:hypothetical protein [Cupriavidus basilensis]MDF3837385.1 hypothetical protein [Cupriavidus basilensis]